MSPRHLQGLIGGSYARNGELGHMQSAVVYLPSLQAKHKVLYVALQVGPPPGFGGLPLDQQGNATHGGLTMLPSPFQSVSDFQSFGSESSSVPTAPEAATGSGPGATSYVTALPTVPKDIAASTRNGFMYNAAQAATLWAVPKEANYLNGLGSIWGSTPPTAGSSKAPASSEALQQQRAVSRFDFARESMATPPPEIKALPAGGAGHSPVHSPFALPPQAMGPAAPHPLQNGTGALPLSAWPDQGLVGGTAPQNTMNPPLQHEWARGLATTGFTSTSALAAQLPDQAALQQHMGESFMAPYANTNVAPPQKPSGLALLRQLQMGGLRGEAVAQQGYGLGAMGGMPTLSLPPSAGFIDPAIMAAQRAASLQGDPDLLEDTLPVD